QSCALTSEFYVVLADRAACRYRLLFEPTPASLQTTQELGATALAEQVDAVTLESVNAFVAEEAAGPMTWVTIGPEALTPPSA
ncbi:MAG: hypothetical protein AAGM38_19230, partial [Pseudomonadota bacterium]